MGEVKILEQQPVDNPGPTPTAKWLTCLIEVMILVLGLVLVVLLRVGFYEPAYIPSASMENTLQIGDRVLIDHRKGLKGRWKRGDIVIFEGDERWGDADILIKRIVGLPGERVEILNGQLYIDGKALAENYLKETPEREDAPPTVLEKDEYFVLGDNRNKSDDSRFNGPVNVDQIRGRAILVFFPLGRFGRLPAADYAP